MKSLDETLQGWCNEGRVTRKEIAAAADCGVGPVGEWISAEAKPGLESCREMISKRSRLPRDIKDYIARWMLRDTEYTPCEVEKPSPKELDLNGNGDVDANDCNRWSGAGNQEVAKALSLLANGDTGDDVRGVLTKAIAHLQNSVSTLDVIEERKQRGPRRVG